MKYSQDNHLAGQRVPWIYGTQEPITTLKGAHILSHMNTIQTLISYLTILCELSLKEITVATNCTQND
jgi:hypothetical protein